MRALSLLVTLGLPACFSDISGGGGGSTDADTSSTGSTGASGSSDESSGSSSDEGEASSSVDTSSDTTASVDAECGNGIAEPGEDCDDANGDELDGCFASCRLGPIGIEIVESDSPRPMGAQGLVQQSESCLIGGSDRALALTSGMLGGPGAGDTWPTSHGGGCQQLRLTADAGPIEIVVGEAGPMLTEFGDDGGQGPWSLQCPTGLLPVGMRGRQFAHTTPFMRSLALECARPMVVLDDGSPRVVLVEPQTTAPTPSNELGDDDASLCPPDTIAIGFQGRITMLPAVEDIGPVCGRVELVFPDP